MTHFIVAAAPSLVGADEQAFVERISGPRGRWDTYSSTLTAADCVDIDRRAYRDARSWFLHADGSDPTEVDGVSLGRAYEWAATTELIRLYRAERVLERISEGRPGLSIELRGVNREWAFAADALGLKLTERRPTVPGPLPGTRVTRAPRYVRAAARFLSVGAGPPRVGLVYGRSWAIAYGRALAARWPLVTIEAGPKYLLAMLIARRSMRTGWIDAGRHDARPPKDSIAHPYLGDLWHSATADLAIAQEFGRELGSQVPVLVACQDALPPERAVLLGARAAGARIVTLEHGISGGFIDQIETLSDVLGVWGEPHVAYHRPLAPASTRVEVVGWPRLEGMRPSKDPSKRPDMRWDVVFFAQPAQDLGAGSWPEDQLRSVEIVEAYAAAHPDLRIGIKFHPSTSAFGFEPAALRHSERVRGDSLRALRHTRTAVVSLSTTGIEAMALGVPVASLGTIGQLGGVNFIAQSGAPVARDADQLSEVLEPLLMDARDYDRSVEHGREYARRFIAGLDEPGSAVRRLLGVVGTLQA